MSRKYNKIISILIILAVGILILVIHASRANQLAERTASKMQLPEIQSTYIFVSFSMNKASLRNYFQEAERYGAILVIRGLVGDKNERNRFVETRNKAIETKINFDINPNLFQQLNIKRVPTMAVIAEDGTVRKVSGHITLEKALEIMQVPAGEK